MNRTYTGFLPYIWKRTLTNTISKNESAFLIAELHIFSILINTSSCPWALDVSSYLIILIYHYLQTEVKKAYYLLHKFDFLVSCCYLMGYSTRQKKALKWFVFVLKFETSLLFIKSGGMTGIFLPL